MLMVKLLTLTILPKILHKQKFGQRGVKNFESNITYSTGTCEIV